MFLLFEHFFPIFVTKTEEHPDRPILLFLINL